MFDKLIRQIILIISNDYEMTEEQKEEILKKIIEEV